MITRRMEIDLLAIHTAININITTKTIHGSIRLLTIYTFGGKCAVVGVVLPFCAVKKFGVKGSSRVC